VHRLDAAVLYKLILETGGPGLRYHGVAEEGVPFREIAAAIGRGLDVPVVSKTPEKAAEHFGWFAHFAGIDNRVSSARTRDVLGWQPQQPGLIADLDGPTGYFAV
jgi:nucleoside-diphosphate-sugar epimerase